MVQAPPVVRPQWSAWGTVPWGDGDEALARRLVQAELDRDAGAEAIGEAWHRDEVGWRGRAAWAWGRIGSTQAREELSGRLGDGRIELDAATLAAVALLPAPGADEEPRAAAWDELEDRLWVRYAVTEAAPEADALLLGVARVGGSRSMGRLAADLKVRPAEDEAPRYVRGMEALAILCARGYALPMEAVEVIGEGLGDGPGASATTRGAAAYALGRCAAVSAETLAGVERSGLVEQLGVLTAGEDMEAARRAWGALEGLGALPRAVPGWVLDERPTDWMTEVAAVRALSAHADGRKVLARRLEQVKVESMEGPRLHALHEALVRLRPYAAHEAALDGVLERLVEAIEVARASASEPGRGKALALVGCEARVLIATRSGSLEGISTCAREVTTVPAEHGDELVIEALVDMGEAMPREEQVRRLLEWAKDERPSVAASALSALTGIDDPAVAPVLRVGLSHADMGVAAAAAAAIGTRAADASRRDPLAIEPLLAVVRRFDDEHAVETRIAAIDALGRLARSSADAGATEVAWLEDELVPLSGDRAAAVRAAARRALRGHAALLEAFDAGVPARMPDGFAPAVHEAVTRWGDRAKGLRLHTDAGVITIDLTGAPAPVAQASLAALAERGFFDGLMFHRVVPGFVIQGGDPRGDGYGGPGYVMPCEWSNLRYERGTVGIALAGKDTGGSQLFITHDEPHHLDARYTVIGKVVEGMEVVDAIWPYDRISRVEVLETQAALEPASGPPSDGSAP